MGIISQVQVPSSSSGVRERRTSPQMSLPSDDLWVLTGILVVAGREGDRPPAQPPPRSTSVVYCFSKDTSPSMFFIYLVYHLFLQ